MIDLSKDLLKSFTISSSPSPQHTLISCKEYGLSSLIESCSVLVWQEYIAFILLLKIPLTTHSSTYKEKQENLFSFPADTFKNIRKNITNVLKFMGRRK